ncbi:hypothetical protein JIR001_17170 [Polycladomyces abyssicola]|uniref:Uncharacterized protein n=1 Tax=Polycladomyces abyssicola TaxID=1125966 RepID=A0A8D5UF30_9BACL|nr:hypothetical protein JIR001_17170 [Polycladomyces abyssicola]
MVIRRLGFRAATAWLTLWDTLNMPSSDMFPNTATVGRLPPISFSTRNTAIMAFELALYASLISR